MWIYVTKLTGYSRFLLPVFLLLLLLLLLLLIIIIIIYRLMQGIYNYISETNHVCRVYGVRAILYLHILGKVNK